MSERNYVVYEPTPNGEGIVIAVFDTIEMATLFISAYLEKFYNESNIAIKRISVNDSTTIKRYMEMEIEYDED